MAQPTYLEHRDHFTTLMQALAHKGPMELHSQKDQLEEIGKELEERFRPLEFLDHIFTHHEVELSLMATKKTVFVWSKFMDGISRRMLLATDQEFIVFAQKRQIKPFELTRFRKNLLWEEMIIFLLQQADSKKDYSRMEDFM